MSFFNSTAFGPVYENGIFVGDITTGTLFYFESNANRTGINLDDDPVSSDLVANSDEEMSAVTLGTGFAGITDIETGPDGNLYILTFDRGAEGQGSLYRILPAAQGDTTTPAAGNTIPSPPPASPQDVEDENGVDSEEQDAPDQDNEDENDDTDGDE